MRYTGTVSLQCTSGLVSITHRPGPKLGRRTVVLGSRIGVVYGRVYFTWTMIIVGVHRWYSLIRFVKINEEFWWDVR